MKVVEAAIAVLLIVGVLLVVINKYNPNQKDVSGIYQKELAILREIRLDDSMRNSILGVDENDGLPVEWEDFNDKDLGNVRAKIETEIYENLENLNCSAKLCVLNKTCVLNNPPSEEVYSQSVAIIANLTIYNPVQLKLFCWEKPI